MSGLIGRRKGCCWGTGSAILLLPILGLFADEPAGPQPAPANSAPTILIRPYNYDPQNEWDYTLRRGEVAPGHSAGGLVWNAAPATRPLAGPPEAGEAPPRLAGPVMSYDAAYAAVPFSRAEYEAYPGYRHDAAMELMFGQMRPTTIVKQHTPYASRYPDFYRYPRGVYPGFGGFNANSYYGTGFGGYGGFWGW